MGDGMGGCAIDCKGQAYCEACVPRYGPKDENGQDALLMTTRMRGIVGEECDGCRATFRQPTRREVQRLDYGESRQEILSLY